MFKYIKKTTDISQGGAESGDHCVSVALALRYINGFYSSTCKKKGTLKEDSVFFFLKD